MFSEVLPHNSPVLNSTDYEVYGVVQQYQCELQVVRLNKLSLRLVEIWQCSNTAFQYKQLNYYRGTTRCVMSVEILPTAMQQCRNYLYDKSWTNGSYEVGGLQWGNVHSTMTQSSRFHCPIGVINKPTTDELWISPVYRRLAVAKFSKSTRQKLLAWPRPRPLREHSLITRLRIHMANPLYCTKFEVSSFSHCGHISQGVKF